MLDKFQKNATHMKLEFAPKKFQGISKLIPHVSAEAQDVILKMLILTRLRREVENMNSTCACVVKRLKWGDILIIWRLILIFGSNLQHFVYFIPLYLPWRPTSPLRTSCCAVWSSHLNRGICIVPLRRPSSLLWLLCVAGYIWYKTRSKVSPL